MALTNVRVSNPELARQLRGFSKRENQKSAKLSPQDYFAAIENSQRVNVLASIGLASEIRSHYEDGRSDEDWTSYCLNLYQEATADDLTGLVKDQILSNLPAPLKPLIKPNSTSSVIGNLIVAVGQILAHHNSEPSEEAQAIAESYLYNFYN